MAKRIAPHFIDELQNRVDVVSTIHSRVPLKKAGKDFQACCPFHNEKTPSFTVSSQKQFYYCFGCGAKGGAINFLMEFEHLSFVEAVEKLAEENGIEVEYEQLSQSTVEKIELRKTLHDLLEETAAVYETNLFQSHIGDTARSYLSERQLDKETSTFFRLGYSQSGNSLQRHFGPSVAPEDLQQTGLLGKGDNGFYDFFRDRLMFPIRDARGKVVGFGARALGDAKPKYINTSDTELFNKSHVLYGLYEELQTNRSIEHLIVVEGYMDVIALHQMGVSGAVAALGTAFTQGHLNLVRKYTKKIVICFDGDKAGKKAAKRAMEMILPAMTTDTEIRMVFLPDGEDPDTLVRKIGKTAFLELLTTGQYFSQFVCETIIADSDLNLIEGRGEMAVRAKALFDLLPDGAYKQALHEELTERAGRDIYQLAKEAQPAATSPSYSKKPIARKSYAPKLQGGLESRIIRLLATAPELVAHVQHECLLHDSDDLDKELLYRLIQCLQLHELDRDASQEALESYIVSRFDGDLAKRLQKILATEHLGGALPHERIEERKKRIQSDFIAAVEKLLNDIQQKNARLL